MTIAKWQVTNSGSLQQLIRQFTTAPHPRRRQRTTEETERWIIGHFLECCKTCHPKTFPVEIVHDDKPDIFITEESAGSVGIEITELIEQNFANALALNELLSTPTSVISTSHFRETEKPMSPTEIRAALKDSGGGPGWRGGSAKHEWADLFFKKLSKKTEKLNKTYSIADTNRLVFYDNPTLGITDFHLDPIIGIVFERLSESYFGKHSGTLKFDFISVVMSDGKRCITFGEDGYIFEPQMAARAG
jgi:hypothetical protein